MTEKNSTSDDTSKTGTNSTNNNVNPLKVKLDKKKPIIIDFSDKKKSNQVSTTNVTTNSIPIKNNDSFKIPNSGSSIEKTEPADSNPSKNYFNINKKLLIPKAFYFCFFSGWGSLLPYLALYFKQLLLTPTEVGLLMGVKPFVNFLIVPIWGGIVDRFNLQRVVLTTSIFALIISTFSIILVPSPRETQMLIDNHCNRTSYPWWSKSQFNESHANSEGNANGQDMNKTSRNSINGTNNLLTNYHRMKLKENSANARKLHQSAPEYIWTWPVEMSIGTGFIDEQEDTSAMDLNSLFSSINHNDSSTNSTENDSTSYNNKNHKSIENYSIEGGNTFMILFMIILVGTLFGSPTLAIVDTATVAMLVDEKQSYGRQRLMGSLGWGVAAFSIGGILYTTHRCWFGRSVDIVDYQPCFYVFSIMMTIAFFISFLFKFEKIPISKTNELIKSIAAVLKCPTYLMFLLAVLYAGFLMAFIKTFLFWHLKDIGATQMIFSSISAVNCVAEVSMYFWADNLINKMGEIGVLRFGLICYIIRLFYYSFITNPWSVLVVELLPGITTAAFWSASLTYVNNNSATGTKTTMQCVLHGVHWGLGYGLGEIVGGILVHNFGAPKSFILSAIFCIFILMLHVLVVKQNNDDPKQNTTTN